MRAAEVSILNFFLFILRMPYTHMVTLIGTYCRADSRDFFFLQEDAATKTNKRGR